MGDQAPTFAVTTVDGEDFDLEECLGKQVVLLTFWSEGCPYSREFIPQFAELVEELAGGEAANEEENAKGESAATGGAETPAEPAGESAAEETAKPSADEEGPEVADLKVMTLSRSTEGPAKWLEENKLDLPLAGDPDGKAHAAYAVGATPHTVLIGADGTIQAIWVGYSADTLVTMKDYVPRVRKGEKVAGEASMLQPGGG